MDIHAKHSVKLSQSVTFIFPHSSLVSPQYMTTQHTHREIINTHQSSAVSFAVISVCIEWSPKVWSTQLNFFHNWFFIK